MTEEPPADRAIDTGSLSEAGVGRDEVDDGANSGAEGGGEVTEDAAAGDRAQTADGAFSDAEEESPEVLRFPLPF